MFGICTRTMVGMMRPWGLVKSCHLVKPISVSLVTGSYLTQQEGLPSLPLPSLQQSCEHYLACVEPIVEVDELKHTKELVVEFQKPGGVGEILQRSLERREYRTENWLTDFAVGYYLYERKPAVIHANFGVLYPRMDFRHKQGQMRCAAKAIVGVLNVKAMIDKKKLKMMKSPTVPLPMPRKLPFNISAEIRKAIEDAKQSMDILCQDLDTSLTVFDHFGKNFLKAHKISPDAFVQIAIQLAYYRMYHRCAVVHEAVTLRQFRLGRIAPICPTSSASAAFVKAFDDPQKQISVKVDLLEKAVKVHKSLINTTTSGQGWDHLARLKAQAVEQKIPMPDIFTDTSFSKLLDYNLSTSQVTSKTGCVPLTCAEVQNGYDVSYVIHNDEIIFFMTAFNSCKETNAAHLIQTLEDAMLDMRTLLEHIL